MIIIIIIIIIMMMDYCSFHQEVVSIWQRIDSLRCVGPERNKALTGKYYT